MAAPRTFATIAAHAFGEAGAGGLGSAPGSVLVGRLVANTSFVRAVARHADFERFRFYVGEATERQGLEGLFSDTLGERLELRNLVHLPDDLAAGEVSVLHHGSHLDRFLDLVWLRDRYARAAVPVTGQIHTLSYPRSTNDYLRALLIPPRETDAILCSTESGRRVVENVFEGLREELRARGHELAPLACELPVVPLGVDVEELSRGDGPTLRAEIGVPADAFCALVLARFSEYDKMDLFPLLLAFRDATAAIEGDGFLVLAGARQGTKTPEMVQLWARALGLEDRVRFVLDFPEERKRDLLAAADVFLSPTDNPQETFGITVIEAQAAGLPCVVTDFDGYRESVDEEVGVRVPTSWSPPTGALADVAPLLYERPLHLFLGQSVTVDLDALTSAIVRLANDPAERARLGAAAARRARERYDWSVVVAQVEDVWRRLTAKPFEPTSGRHPLGLDWTRAFGHYATTELDPARTLEAAPHGQWTRENEVPHPVYPELTNLFDEAWVRDALELVGAGELRADNLVEQLAARHAETPPWRLERLVAWLEKQGLVRATN